MTEEQQMPVEEAPDPATPQEKPFLVLNSQKDHDLYLQRMIKERLARKEEQFKAREEQEREEREREAREKVLEEQENWKKLAEERTNTLAEKDKRIEELSSLETERDTANERVTALEERLRGIIKPRLEVVPELYRPFVESMTVEEQADWLEKNGEKLETPATPRPTGSPPTGKARGNGADEEQAKQAREQQRSVSRI